MLKPNVIGEIGLALWYLPLHRVAEIQAMVRELSEKEGYKVPTDDSDEWTDEDLRDFGWASLERWIQEEEGDDVRNAQAG